MIAKSNAAGNSLLVPNMSVLSPRRESRLPVVTSYKKMAQESWTERREHQARHKAWQLHKVLYKVKESFTDVLKTHSSNGTLHRRSEHVQNPTDHKVEGQDVHCRPWCFFIHDEDRSLSSQERRTTRQTKYYLDIQTANGIVLSTTSRNSAPICT